MPSLLPIYLLAIYIVKGDRGLISRSYDVFAFLSVLRKEYLLIQQIFISCLHCTKTQWLMISKADKDSSPLGAYILEGKRDSKQYTKKISKLSDDQEE